MTKEIVTVKYVNTPAAGKKKGNIKTNDGRIFGVWPDKLAEFKPGGTYEIETESNEFNGKTYHSVKSATPVNGTAAAATTAVPTQPNSPKEDARRYLMRSANLLKLAHSAAKAVIGDNYQGEDARTLFIDAQRAGYVCLMSDAPLAANDGETDFEL